MHTRIEFIDRATVADQNLAEDITMTKTVQADAIKFYARRDSATTVLRKLGVKPRDYDFFIEKTSDGQFVCQIVKAQLHLKALTEAAKPAEEKPAFEPKAVKSAKSKPVKSPKPVAAAKSSGISAMARSMIADGYSNQEIWEKLKSEFKLDDSKKHYPTWYRCEMKRKAAAA